MTAAWENEERRNRLLRRVDWRFLLSCSQPVRTVCCAGDDLATAVREVSREVVDPKEAAPGTADLAVAGSRYGDWRWAYAALRPGGTLYIEWYRPRPRAVTAVHRTLARAGFVDTACYIAWPPHRVASPRYWIPADGNGVVRFLLATRHSRQGLIGRLVRQGIGTVWEVVQLLGLLPLSVLARKPSPDPAVHEGDVYDTVAARWSDWSTDKAPGPGDRLLLTAGHRAVNKAVVLLFDRWDRPRLVLKMPRVPESVEGLRREATALRTLQATHPGGIEGAPKLLLTCEQDHSLVLGESVEQGRPLYTALTSSYYAELARRGTDWLTALADRERLEDQVDRWETVEAALDKFEGCYDGVVAKAQFRQARSLLKTLDVLPTAIEHRDFSPWNVHVREDGGLAVLDWESAEPSGLPCLDLIYFLTYLAFFRTRAMKTGRYLEAYRESQSEHTETGRVSLACLDRYTRALSISRDAVRPLRLLTWTIHACSEHGRLVADHGAAPPRDALAGAMFLGLWKHDLETGGL